MDNKPIIRNIFETKIFYCKLKRKTCKYCVYEQEKWKCIYHNWKDDSIKVFIGKIICPDS